MKITALVENTTTHDDIETEHGLSLYIEANGHKILFDMGQSDMFARNADRLGIDLEDVDMCVLSHGHYDHGGGIKTFLELNKKAKIYMNEYAFEPHYNGTEKYIGLDVSLISHKKNHEITGYRETKKVWGEQVGSSGRFVMVGDELELDTGLTLYSCNKKVRENNLGAFGLTVMKDGLLMEDDFRHEQYLLIEEDGKKILISGCSHKGIVDITNWFKPDVLVGGFHFMKLDVEKDKDVLMDAATKLMSHKTKYYTCHCTGCEQYDFLKSIMNEQVEYIRAGDYAQ